MSIITKGFVSLSPVTSGFGGPLVIVVDDRLPLLLGGGGLRRSTSSKRKKDEDFLDVGVIASLSIRVLKPHETSHPRVDVVFTNSKDLEAIRAEAKLMGYEDVRVYLREDVEIT